MQAIGLKVLEWVLPMVLGPLVYYAARELLNLSAKVDDLPPVLKRVAVVGIGIVITGVFNVLNIVAPEQCVALTGTATAAGTDALHACAVALTQKVPVQGVTSGLVAILIHALKKQSPRN